MNDPYVFKNQEGIYILKNKLGIVKRDKLDEQEHTITVAKEMELLDNNSVIEITGETPFERLKFIHKYLFNEIYEWAGELRTVNISKGGTSFANTKFFENAINEISSSPIDEDSLYEIYNSFNVFHPFREGNGRAGRIWLILEARELLSVDIRFNEIVKSDYMDAMMSFDAKVIKTVISSGYNKDIAPDRHVNWNNLVASHQYEGYYGDFYGQAHEFDTQPIKVKKIKGYEHLM